MSIRDAYYALRANPDVDRIEEMAKWGLSSWAGLGWYLSQEGVDCTEIGSTLLVPTYRLEEVEEVVEPEKPGVPVEPYVGLSWEYMGDKRVVIEVSSEWYVVVSQAGGNWYKNFERQPLSFREWANYPRTPSTPAVTRKVKKWVKIEHPEVLPND